MIWQVFINVESHEMVDPTYSKGDVKWDPQNPRGMGYIAESV